MAVMPKLKLTAIQDPNGRTRLVSDGVDLEGMTHDEEDEYTAHVEACQAAGKGYSRAGWLVRHEAPNRAARRRMAALVRRGVDEDGNPTRSSKSRR